MQSLSPLRKEAKNPECMFAYEFAGLNSGKKKAAILYVKKSEINELLNLLDAKGLYYAVSDFVLDAKGASLQPTFYHPDNAFFSIYVAKEKEIVKRIQYLESFNQFKETPKELTKEELFFETTELLGYPSCCAQFHFSSVKKSCKERDLLGKSISEETFFSLIPFFKSKKINHLLNYYPCSSSRLINFYTCDYNCQYAITQAKRTLQYIKKHTDYTNTIVQALKVPYLFFSQNEIIYLPESTIKNDIVEFKKLEYFNENKKNIPSSYSEAAKNISHMDSFTCDDTKIVFFKNGIPRLRIRKKHKYDGVYVHFTE